MTDYSDMSYFQLKTECAKQGLDTKGTKVELLGRLGVDASVSEIKEEVAKDEAKQEDYYTDPEFQDRLKSLRPDTNFIVRRDPKIFTPFIADSRLESLASKLDEISAGKGRWNYQLDHDKQAYVVEFSGGAPGLQCESIITPDITILNRANQYFNARYATGKNGGISRV